MYRMNDLVSLTGKSAQSLYKLIKHNQELSTIVSHNSKSAGHMRLYGEPVLKWLLDYYKIEDMTEENLTPQGKIVSSEDIPQINPHSELIEALKARVEDLTKERDRLITENAQLLLLLQENAQLMKREAEQRQLYLPKPRQSLGTAIKNLFKKGAPANDKN